MKNFTNLKSYLAILLFFIGSNIALNAQTNCFVNTTCNCVLTLNITPLANAPWQGQFGRIGNGPCATLNGPAGQTQTFQFLVDADATGSITYAYSFSSGGSTTPVLVQITGCGVNVSQVFTPSVGFINANPIMDCSNTNDCNNVFFLETYCGYESICDPCVVGLDAITHLAVYTTDPFFSSNPNNDLASNNVAVTWYNASGGVLHNGASYEYSNPDDAAYVEITTWPNGVMTICTLPVDFDCGDLSPNPTTEFEQVATSKDLGKSKVFPNPANDLLQIQNGHSNTVIGQLVDLTGSVINQFVINGNTTFELPVHQMAAGIYLLQAVDQVTGERIINEKVVIKH